MVPTLLRIFSHGPGHFKNILIYSISAIVLATIIAENLHEQIYQWVFHSECTPNNRNKSCNRHKIRWNI